MIDHGTGASRQPLLGDQGEIGRRHTVAASASLTAIDVAPVAMSCFHSASSKPVASAAGIDGAVRLENLANAVCRSVWSVVSYESGATERSDPSLLLFVVLGVGGGGEEELLRVVVQMVFEDCSGVEGYVPRGITLRWTEPASPGQKITLFGPQVRSATGCRAGVWATTQTSSAAGSGI